MKRQVTGCEKTCANHIMSCKLEYFLKVLKFSRIKNGKS